MLYINAIFSYRLMFMLLRAHFNGMFQIMLVFAIYAILLPTESIHY
jgi:hypothetical protein